MAPGRATDVETAGIPVGEALEGEGAVGGDLQQDDGVVRKDDDGNVPSSPPIVPHSRSRRSRDD